LRAAQNHSTSTARSFARHVDSLVRKVSPKFEEMGPLADWFVERLADVVLHQATKLQADLVVPVPLHKDHRRERGFTQAELLPGETAGNFLTRACFW